MIDKWLILGGAHFAVTAVLLKILGLLLPCCITSHYSGIANFVLYVFVAKLTFDFTKRWYLNDRLQPENRAVFITGCDSGFGHNAAKMFDSLGYPVFAGCLDPNGKGAEDLRKSCSRRMQVLEVDVTKDSSVKRAADYVKDNLGTSELWAIVNNAGIVKGFEVELTTIEDFKDTMEVNAIGPVRVTKAFLPLLRQSRGRVINITSLAGRCVLPYAATYSMSKHAAVAFNDCLRTEMDIWGVRVISIEPDFYCTNMTNPDNLKKQMDKSYDITDQDVIEDYGERYLRSVRCFTDLLPCITSKDITPVLSAIDEAVSLKYPDSVYKPRKNILFRIIYCCLENAPVSVFHIFSKAFLKASRFPKPKEAENYS